VCASDAPKVISPPPESFFEMVRSRDRDAAREFYKKYVDVNGMPVVAAGEVDDRALVRTHEIVSHMLAGRPDIVDAMKENEMYLIIIGKDQLYTDMPEYRNSRNKEYLNERVRGTGGRPTSFGEENLLSLPLDRYDDESIGVHEFCHTIDGALRSIDPDWSDRRNAVYDNAIAKGLYKNAYAGSNPGEYWAEIGQAYFDCNRVNNWNHGPVANREQLKAYDPEGYELCRSIFRLEPDQDWRYSWVEKLPNITAPPAKFKIDPYYTKFTWAREFTVLGRDASDEALLRANDTIRKMFAYRHDVLKALIADGAKLVVLGPDEGLYDLHELKDAAGKDVDRLARTLDYGPAAKLIVVGQENVLGDPHKPGVGSNQVIRAFAKAMLDFTGRRSVDPDFRNRGRNVQQYELRVERLDERFGAKVDELFKAAIEKGKWKGTAAVNTSADYWCAGVLAYFDAAGQEAAPNDADFPITTREALEQYDPDLYAIVHETMAYAGHVDWRYAPHTKALAK
jgi:alpha-glucosidase